MPARPYPPPRQPGVPDLDDVLVNVTVTRTMLDDHGDRLALALLASRRGRGGKATASLRTTCPPLERGGHILIGRERSGQGGVR